MKYKIDFFYSIYFFLNHHRNWYSKDGRVRCRVFKFALWYYSWFENFLNQTVVTYYKDNPIQISPFRKQQIIASLTSFPARIDTTWIAIESIFHQTVKPDRIILWLADSQFPGGLSDLPKQLLDQTKNGLEIRFCKDLRSHKKYYYVMKEHPNDIIILFDDDSFYLGNTIEKLVKMHCKHPNTVIAFSSYRPFPSLKSPCSSWIPYDKEDCREPSYLTQVFSGLGSLWPPNVLDSRFLDEEKLLSLTPYADDLWLYVMMLLKGTKACRYRKKVDFPHEIGKTQEYSLFRINGSIGENQNDIQWRNLLNVYGDELHAKFPDIY